MLGCVAAGIGVAMIPKKRPDDVSGTAPAQRSWSRSKRESHEDRSGLAHRSGLAKRAGPGAGIAGM